MPQSRPMKDLKNTNEISEPCNKSAEPIYTKLEVYEKLAEAEAQVKNGEELLEAEDVFKGLRKEYKKK